MVRALATILIYHAKNILMHLSWKKCDKSMSYYLLEKIMYEKEMVRVHVQWTPFNLYSSYKRWSKKNRRNAL